MNIKQLLKNAPWLKEAQDFGPRPGSAAPYSPNNPGNLRRLLNCTVTLNGSMLDITNNDDSIALNLTPEQVRIMSSEMQMDTQTGITPPA